MKRNWSLGRLHALGKTISGLGLALAVLAALLRASPARVPLMVAGAVVILAGIIFNAVKVRCPKCRCPKCRCPLPSYGRRLPERCPQCGQPLEDGEEE